MEERKKGIQRLREKGGRREGGRGGERGRKEGRRGGQRGRERERRG